MENLKARYRAGKVGDGEVTDKLTLARSRFLAPICERMAYYDSRPGLVEEIMLKGTRRMRQIGAETMGEVRKAMGLDRVLDRMRRASNEDRMTPKGL